MRTRPNVPSVEALAPQSVCLYVCPACTSDTCQWTDLRKGRAGTLRTASWQRCTLDRYLANRDTRWPVSAYEKMNAYKAETGKDVQVLLLQNHGIFVAADTVEEIGVLFDGVIGKAGESR